ncbi:MAG TPA: hypothetical protein VKQ73_02795 [Stellaceae bacterium]|nr:hypothetical protein [Stellaceae bacterium]
MTLAEAGEIFGYWEQNPPPHLLLQAIARLLGWTPPPVTAGLAALADLAAAPPPGLALVRGDLGMPPPQDIETLRARNRTRRTANREGNAPPLRSR